MKKRITKQAVDAFHAKKGRPEFLWDTTVTGFGCKTTPAGKKVFVFQYRTRGQTKRDAPKRITLGGHGQITADQARRHAARLLLSVKAGDDPGVAWRRGQGAPTVADLADRFLDEYLPGKKRPPRRSTAEYYRGLFRVHIVPKMGRRPVEAVTTADVERLHKDLAKKPYIANRTLSLIQHAFDQAERWEWRPQHTNPALHIEKYPEPKRGAKKEVMLTPEQMSQLLKAIDIEEEAGTDPIACAAIRFTFWTGWRIRSEVLRLRWDRIDPETGRARLTKTKTQEEEYRSLPLEALQVLEGLPRLVGCPYVFPGRNSTTNLTTVKKPWEKIRKRAGLDNLEGLGGFRVHDLRHNVVSWDVSRGVPLEIAGKNVGHRSRKSTEVYAHFSPDSLRQAADDRARAMREAVEQTA